MDIDKKKRIKTLIFQCNALRNSVERSLQDTATLETGRYDIQRFADCSRTLCQSLFHPNLLKTQHNTKAQY